MSLVNDSLKFTSSDTQIWWNVLLKKMWVATHILPAKIIRIWFIESAKTVNEMTLNELVKLPTLWTTGPSICAHSFIRNRHLIVAGYAVRVEGNLASCLLLMKRLIATVSIVRIDEINVAIQPLRPSKFISINNSFLQVIDLTSASWGGTTSVKNIQLQYLP